MQYFIILISDEYITNLIGIERINNSYQSRGKFYIFTCNHDIIILRYDRIDQKKSKDQQKKN